MDVLLNPVHFALAGPHSGFALHEGRAARYLSDVSPFAALPPEAEQADWDDLARIAGAGIAVVDPDPVPEPWQVVQRYPGWQLVYAGATPDADPGIVPLGVDDMVELVELTHPGPFERRTVELGGYVGIRDGGRLVAMAGERMRPPGWTEISAVCTAPDQQGRGLARRVVGEVVRGIRARGEEAFLHVLGTNERAIGLYRSMGFVDGRQVMIVALAPAGSGATAPH